MTHDEVSILFRGGEVRDLSRLAPETQERIREGLRQYLGTGAMRPLIKEFVQRIGVAQWKLDLYAFCELAGFLPDDYGKAKFRQFTELNKALSHFDTETLCKILGVDQ